MVVLDSGMLFNPKCHLLWRDSKVPSAWTDVDPDGLFNGALARSLSSLFVNVWCNSHCAEKANKQSLLDLLGCQMGFLWWRGGAVLFACNVGTNLFEFRPVRKWGANAAFCKWDWTISRHQVLFGVCICLFLFFCISLALSALFCLSALLQRHPEPWCMCSATSHRFVPRCWREAVSTLLSHQMATWENGPF